MPEEPNEASGNRASDGRTPRLIHNRLSLVGVAIAVFVFGNLFFLLVLSLFGVQNPYLGILAYLIFPLLALLAILLIIVGMLRERRRRRTRQPSIPLYPRIDLNTAAGRRVLAIGVVSFFAFVAGTSALTYKAYHFTDTVGFCGRTCHTVMKPEYTAYQDSPHARVPCVSCHVGPGAAWYVRSKLSGLYQVYAVVSGTYPRPITTPIKDLRPVRQACEQCHWPQKFYGAQLKVFTHFAYDKDNTPMQIRMLIKTGGGSPELGRAAGIHWHMNIANKVWFRATDKQNQHIPWVKVRSSNGRVTIYTEKGTKLSPKQLKALPIQAMDCVTCHDRPAHKFRPPDEAVDQAFVAGNLDKSLPYLKKEAVAALTHSYPTTQAAMEGIATSLSNFYEDKYSDTYTSDRPRIIQAIATIQRIYRNNIFPYMKANWRIHPNNIGHFYYKGCFRCHDGKHVSADGRVVTNNCDTCHTILSQTTSGQLMPSTPGQPFDHPIPMSAIKGVACVTCHSGAGLR